MNTARFAIVACLLLLGAPLEAELTDSAEHGFTVSHSITTKAEPFVAYRTMTSHIDQWWSGDHSWSGDGVIGEQLDRLGERLNRD